MKRKKTTGKLHQDGFEEWGGYMAAKTAKLGIQYQDTTDNLLHKKSDIFNGVAIFVNGLTDPSAYELKELMSLHGGVYHFYRSGRSTTHIIASNLPNVKITSLGTTPIVKPSWITESIDAGRLLDYKNHLLYTNENRTQPRLRFVATKTTDTDETRRQRSVSPDLFGDATPPEEESVSLGERPKATKSTKTAVDPGFLSEFYTNSRLHHIATLGATFKQLVTRWREQSDPTFPGRQRLRALDRPDEASHKYRSIVMHIDMDCFFVSVGLRTRPELRGFPVAVTHARSGGSYVARAGVDRDAEIEMVRSRWMDKGVEKTSKLDGVDANSSMSEIACCSYEARNAGLRNGMFLGSALKLCPNLKTMPYDFDGYKEVAHVLYETIARYTLDVEAVSCDEMFVDVGPLLRDTNVSVVQWARHIRQEIQTKTGCTCSTGFGSNRLQARLATRKAKPDGSYHLRSDDVEEYMKEVPLSDLPGVGHSILSKLNRLGLKTCGDVRSYPLSRLRTELGAKLGETLFDQCRGDDKKPLRFQHERKSVSAEVNYGIRFDTFDEAKTFLKNLSDELEVRLADTGMHAKSVTLKLMVRAKEAPKETAKFLGHGVCDSLSRSVTVSVPIVTAAVIFKEALMLYEKLGVAPTELRGVGLQLGRLERFKDKTNNALSKYLVTGGTTGAVVATKKVMVNVATVTDNIGAELDVTKKSGRGRPRKASTFNKSDSKGVLTKFFKSVGNPTPNDIQTKQIYMQQNIDMSVLAQLPDDIRKEIIEDYELNDAAINKPTIKQLSVPGPSTEVPIKAASTKPSVVSIFNNFKYDGLKTMLRGWICNETIPQAFDVQMLADHMKQMALGCKIEEAFCIMKFLHRCINKTNACAWHKAYYDIINALQEGMVLRYGTTLLVERKFSCGLH